MPKSKVRYVGLDVHKNSIVIAVAEPGRSAAREIGTVPGDWRSLEKRLGRLADGHRLVICYEAGPTGFELHRRLQQVGYESQVVAPSLIPSKPGERIKTDRRDACKLAQCLRAGDLTPVYVPDEQTEALRDLERARAAAKKAETTARHQLSKFLLRQGRKWEGGSNWTLKHRAWIRQQAFKQEAHRRVLADAIKTLDDATERVERLTADIEELVSTTALAPLVTALQSLRGVATISSVTPSARGPSPVSITAVVSSRPRMKGSASRVLKSCHGPRACLLMGLPQLLSSVTMATPTLDPSLTGLST